MIRAALAAVAAGAVACGSSSEPAPAGVGNPAATALAATFEAAEALRAPWRCALGPAPGVPGATGTVEVGARSWRYDGETLTASRADAEVTIAAVAQARGAAPPVRELLRAGHAEVVIAIGGMGTNPAELRASLGGLVDPGWLTIAVPGDSEDLPALAATVAELATAGAPIVDGARVRLIDAGGAVVALVPGERHAGRLAAGSDGCVHDEVDRARILGLLTATAGDRPRVLVATAAPQGGASDLAPGGIHAGDPELAAMVEAAAIDVVLHAPVDAEVPAPGRGRPGQRLVLAAGSLDPVPRWEPAGGRRRADGITFVTVGARARSWRFVPVALP